MALRDFDKLTGCKIDSLKGIANSERKKQFLKVLSDSKQFIQWLKEETNGELKLLSELGIPIIYKWWRL